MRVISFAIVITSMINVFRSEEDWKTFSPGGVNFSIDFPVEPEVKKEESGRNLALVEDAIKYECMWFVENAILTKDDGRNYIAGMCSAYKEAYGKPVVEKKITVSGIEGREMIIVSGLPLDKQRGVFRVQVLAVEKNIIRLSVWGKNRESVESIEAERYFKSFRIKN